MNHLSLILSGFSRFNITGTSRVNNFVMQNAIALYKGSGGLVDVDSNKIGDIHMSNVNYSINGESSDQLGTGYSSRLHFIGKNELIVNTPLGSSSFNSNRKSFATKSIKNELNKLGIIVSRRKIVRIMKKYNLISVYTKTKYKIIRKK